MWHLPNEMHALPTKIRRANRPNIYTIYKEYIKAIRNNNCNSEYSKHILSTGNIFRCLTDTMNVIRTQKKGKHLNTLEKYHTYVK
jgi:hypothetical protein